jgi:methyl-accepting chemotaxis protein
MKKKSFKIDVLLTVGILIILTTTSLTLFSIINSRSRNNTNAETNLDFAVQLQANKLLAGINDKFEILRTLAHTFIAQKETKSFSRKANIDAMEKILLKNSDIIGIFSQTDPDAFDNNDAQYANKDWYDKTGTFIPYIYRDEKGIPAIIPIELTPDLIAMLKVHRVEKKEVFMDPYFFEVSGKNILMVTATTPYVINDEYKGEIGIDFSIEYMQNEAKILQKKLYNGYSSVSIISSQGIFAANTDNASSIGKNISEYYSKGKVQEILKGEKEKVYVENDSLKIVYPIEFGNTDTPWKIIVAIPQSKINEASTKEMFTLILVGIFILIFSLILMYAFITRLSKPILLTAKIAEVISKGDLTVVIPVSRKDEIATLAISFNLMAAKLREIIGEIKRSATDISIGSNEITSSAVVIAQGSSSQASTTEEISVSMEEILSTISSNSEKAIFTEQISSKSANELELSYKVIKQTIDLVSEISRKITIISEIANKTDILSINAAIEAARSGDAGRGFAVVAQEIRKLADKTKLASIEIEVLSKKGNEISELAGSKLHALLPEITQSAESVRSIVFANQEQKMGVEAINDSVQHLTTITNQNSAAAEQMSVSSAELSAKAEQLKELVAIFKIDK